MEKVSIKKNFAYSTIYQIISVITPLITAPYLSRVLGAKAIGIQSYTSSINTYFTMFVALGTLSYGSREISRCRNDVKKRSRTFWEIEIMTLVTFAICIAVWIVLALCSKEYGIYYMVLTLCLLSTALDISWFFTGLEQFKLIVVRNIIFKLIGIGCLFLFIHSSDDLLLYIAINSVSTLASALSVWPYLRRFVVKIPVSEIHILPHFKETLIYFIPTVATSVYTILDKTLLGWMTRNNVEIGYYQQAEKIIIVAKSLVFTSINSVVGVRISYLFAENRFDEIHQKIRFSMNYIFFMGIGCMFGLIGVAKNFVPFFFGNGYEGVIQLLYILSPIVVVIGVSNCLGVQYYTPSGRRGESTKYLIVGSVINLFFNLLLIPRFLSAGAAFASVIAESVIAILYLKCCNGFMTVKLILKIGWKKLLSGTLMLVNLLVINDINLSIISRLGYQVCSGIAIYAIGLIILRDEWFIGLINRLIQNLMRKIK